MSNLKQKLGTLYKYNDELFEFGEGIEFMKDMGLAKLIIDTYEELKREGIDPFAGGDKQELFEALRLVAASHNSLLRDYIIERKE